LVAETGIPLTDDHHHDQEIGRIEAVRLHDAPETPGRYWCSRCGASAAAADPTHREDLFLRLLWMEISAAALESSL
jgi:hypothetical protein